MAMIVVILIRIVLVLLTIYLSFFSLWRTFEREHIDDVPLAIDRIILAAILSWYLARIPSGIELIFTHAIAPLSILNPLVATSSWQVGIVIFCITLYLFLRENWRDRYALLDFTVVTICVFLFGSMLWEAVSLFVSSLLTQTPPPIGYTITLITGIVYFWGLSQFLSYLERQYRAYFWYRYRRSSAQTGFVTAVFLIASGLFGIISSLYQLPFGVLSLSMFFTVWSLFTFVGGFVLLYIRSGRLKKK